MFVFEQIVQFFDELVKDLGVFLGLDAPTQFIDPLVFFRAVIIFRASEQKAQFGTEL